MHNLLTFSFWFNLRPGSMSPFIFKTLLIFATVLLVAALVLKTMQRKKIALYSNIFQQLSILAVTNSVLLFVWLFFSYELVPLLAARFWYGLLLIEMVVWLILIARKLKQIPARKEQLEREREFKKYLP